MYSGDVARLNIILFGGFGAETGQEIQDIHFGIEETIQSAYEKMVEFANGFIAQVLESRH